MGADQKHQDAASLARIDPQKLYLPREVAPYLRVSPSTTRRMIKAELIRSINISPSGPDGRGTRVLGRWILDYLEKPQKSKEA